MVQKHLKLTGVTRDQGALGHKTVKPTTILTNIPEVTCLDGLRASGRGGEWPEQVGDRVGYSKSLAAWAPGLVEALQRAIRRKCRERGEGHAPELRPLSTRE